MLVLGARAATVPGDEHGRAELALADIHAASAEIVKIEDGNDVGKAAFTRAAQRARNAILGDTDRRFSPGAGNPGDHVGAIGHVDQLLDRRDEQSWTPAMQGVKANLLATAQSLTDAIGETQMESYQLDVTTALADIGLALGKPSQVGVMGGLEGTLGTTTLGVPAGATVAAGCGAPNLGYGVVRGRIAFLAVARSDAAEGIPTDFPVRRIEASGDRLVLYTVGRAELAKLCAASPPSASTSHRHIAVRRAERLVSRLRLANAVAAPATSPSYTVAQATAGAKIFTANCESCHGANLQGVAAPAVAGTAFLPDTIKNGWTYASLRSLVVEQMPLNNPGSLSPNEYAQVISYILASNCFPAGEKPFPTADASELAAKIAAPAGATPSDPKLGTCTVPAATK